LPPASWGVASSCGASPSSCRPARNRESLNFGRGRLNVSRGLLSSDRGRLNLALDGRISAMGCRISAWSCRAQLRPGEAGLGRLNLGRRLLNSASGPSRLASEDWNPPSGCRIRPRTARLQPRARSVSHGVAEPRPKMAKFPPSRPSSPPGRARRRARDGAKGSAHMPDRGDDALDSPLHAWPDGHPRCTFAALPPCVSLSNCYAPRTPEGEPHSASGGGA
jgi:hypothetical protein